jgi:hypothetical protein
VLEQVEQEERRILMALSQAYLTWEKETEQRGIERGESRAQQKSITTILTTRFGAIDDQLAAIVPAIMALPIESATPLLLQLSREELLNRFSS